MEYRNCIFALGVAAFIATGCQKEAPAPEPPPAEPPQSLADMAKSTFLEVVNDKEVQAKLDQLAKRAGQQASAPIMAKYDAERAKIQAQVDSGKKQAADAKKELDALYADTQKKLEDLRTQGIPVDAGK
jgi:hypothetical protein